MDFVFKMNQTFKHYHINLLSGYHQTL